MIQRQYLPCSVFEAAIGSIEQLIEGLIEPPLRRLDEVLADELLLETVLGLLPAEEVIDRVFVTECLAHIWILL